MSVKHVKDYYMQVCNDYKELFEELHDLEEAVSNNLVFPEQLDQMKAQLENLKTNQARIAYIMFLLDMPNNPKKVKKYKKLKKDYLNSVEFKDTLDGVKAENKEVLVAFNNSINQINQKED